MLQRYDASDAVIIGIDVAINVKLSHCPGSTIRESGR